MATLARRTLALARVLFQLVAMAQQAPPDAGAYLTTRR
jgi:hypothetical protein